MFRSDIVRSRQAFYNESNLQADKEACLEFLEHHDFGFVHQVLSFIRLREGSLTSFSESFQTSLSGILYNLVKYGPKYLSEDELSRRTKEHLSNYYSYLGWQVFKWRGRDFWSFHRGKLAAIGYPLSAFRVTTSALSYVLDILLNPKRTVERVASRLSQLRSTSPR